MTEFLIGPASSGKTTLIYSRIADVLRDGRRAVLLVPEQSALIVEGEICSLLQQLNVPQTDFEVLNFTRLCNRVFREYGGISYNGVTQGAKALIMWDALFSTAPYLKYYSSVLDDADRLVPSLLSLTNELKAYNITASDLADAAKEAYADGIGLADKLSDLSLIYAAFSAAVNDKWTDPADELTRLAELLKSKSFFEGCELFIDSFNGFTPQQYSVLEQAFKQADLVTVALTMSENNDIYCFENVKETSKKLIHISRNGHYITYLDSLSSKPIELTHLSNHIWSYADAAPISYHTDVVNAIICDNVYKEAEYVASSIQRKLRRGCKYRDFAVIARNIDEYKGIIDAVFAKNGLPCRVFNAIELSDTPLFKLITAAINIKIRDWSLDDVMVYIKIGLTSLTNDEIFKLEKYTTTWNISGSQWTSEQKWYMNPDGYTDVFADALHSLLDEVNDIRHRVTLPLQKLHESLDGERTVKTICRSIYDFLYEIRVPDRIEASGDDDIRIWNCMCEALDTMVDTIPNKIMSAKLFYSLLSIVVKETSVGSLPSTIDEITVGSADRIIASSIKHAYIIGVIEGTFPKDVSEGSFFSDNDKAYLETCGIVLSPQNESYMCDELYYFYKAITIPTETLSVLCVKASQNGESKRPSVAFNRAAYLIGDVNVFDSSSLGPSETVFTNQSALEYLAYSPKSNDAIALKTLLCDKPEFAFILTEKRQGFSSDANAESIDKEIMKEIFPSDIVLSQSKLEKMALCAMSYQCTYTLKLCEEKRARFDAKDTGNLIHRIVEKFFSSISGADTLPSLSDDDIEKMIDDILNDYLSSIFGNNGIDNISKRALCLFNRLRRTSRIVIKNLLAEFSQSDFVPRFFELPINSSGAEGTVSSIKIPLPDGTFAMLVGYVDRVDICEKNGKLYVRVVDYKTGTKKFDLEDVAMGINLQMLLYLFSIWKDGGGQFRRAVGSSAEIVPTGVLYLIAKTETLDLPPNSDSESIYRLAEESITRNGLLISDEEILRLMEKKLEGKYIPIKIKSDGDYTKGSYDSLRSLEEMGNLLNQITETVTKLATDIKTGKSTCVPLRNGKHDSCKYCPHRSICRNPQSFIKMGFK